jgi:hypothetical protein
MPRTQRWHHTWHEIPEATLALWALKDDLELLYGDVLALWRPWTTNLQGRGLQCGHHMAEEVREEPAGELGSFSLCLSALVRQSTNDSHTQRNLAHGSNVSQNQIATVDAATVPSCCLTESLCDGPKN